MGPMESVAIMINEEVLHAQEKFEDEFQFDGMDTMMMHRFPARLCGMIDKSYIAPRFVAIGPYHHGRKHLKKMEEVKKAAAFFFCELMALEPGQVVREEKFLVAVQEAHGKYSMEKGTKECCFAPFAAMMFYDACFLLLYMDHVYNRCYSKQEDYWVNPSMRRFLLSNRDSIDNDIMLLENQLPWQVVQALMGLVSEDQKKELVSAVGRFTAGMGNTFKVRLFLHRKSYVWDDENNPPPHLLALLLRHKTGQRKPKSYLQHTLERPLLNNFIFKTEKILAPNTPQTQSDPQENPKVNSISKFSPMELEEIGITLTASSTATFSDMSFVEGRFWSELSLAPLTLSNTTASCLVNMAAFEVCNASRFGDHLDQTVVCSYLALLDMLIVGEEDVNTLRSKGLLQGPQSDREVLNFFKTVMKNLPTRGMHFAKVMADIKEYKDRRYIWIPLYKWFHRNYKSIMSVVSIIKVLSLLATLVGLYKAVLSLKNKEQN